MATNNLQLVNEGGSIVAKDPETGETWPVPLGDVDAGSVSTGEVDSETYLQNGEPFEPATVGGAAATTDGSQQIDSGTVTQVNLHSIESDDLGVFNLDNDEAVIQEDGLYLITGYIRWIESPSDSWSTGDRIGVRTVINGNKQSSLHDRKVGTEAQECHLPPLQRPLTEGDTITWEVFQESGDWVYLSDDTALLITRIGDSGN